MQQIRERIRRKAFQNQVLKSHNVRQITDESGLFLVLGRIDDLHYEAQMKAAFRIHGKKSGIITELVAGFRRGVP